MDSHCTLCGAPRPVGTLDAPGDEGCSICGGLRGPSGNADEVHPALQHKLGRASVSERSPAAPPHRPDVPSAAKAEEAPPVPPPDAGWKVEHQGELLRVSWQSTRGRAVLAVLALLGGALLAGVLALGTRPFGADPFLVATLLAALALLLPCYGLLVKAVNRTYVEASRRIGIRVWQGPLPWFSASKSHVAPAAIRQLYGFRPPQPTDRTRRSTPRARHELRVLKADDTSVTLVGSGLTLQQVHFLERALEAHLGIHHAPSLPESPVGAGTSTP
jgi:hypothetical protein